ncbi:histidine phosphatase family protein [Chloroflexota bacterium]
MSRLFLVRHGITEPNSTRRFTGHSDVDLNVEGYSQVEKLRDRLANEEIYAAYSSDLKRALVTAKSIVSGHELEVVSCPDLRELNYGDAEGLTYKEIAGRYPELGRLIHEVDPRMNFPGGERFEDLTTRAGEFLERINGHTEDETILVVTHGGMLRTLTCLLLRLELSHWSSFRFDNASLTIIDTYPRRAIISLLNDTSHLNDTGGMK